MSCGAYAELVASGATMEVQHAAASDYFQMLVEGIRPQHSQVASALKGRQAGKIQEIADALVASGCVALDQQARALGLGRSTAWNILVSHYKNTGLSAKTINHILSSPRLPQRVRVLVVEYVEDKLAGRYGHNKLQRRRFAALLTAMLAESGHLEDIAA